MNVLESAWPLYRRWRNALWFPAASLAALILSDSKSRPLLIVAGVTLGLLVVSYLAEEVAWNLRGRGRACPHCGHSTRLRSFRIARSCPGCGKEL